MFNNIFHEESNRLRTVLKPLLLDFNKWTFKILVISLNMFVVVGRIRTQNVKWWQGFTRLNHRSCRFPTSSSEKCVQEEKEATKGEKVSIYLINLADWWFLYIKGEGGEREREREREEEGERERHKIKSLKSAEKIFPS